MINHKNYNKKQSNKDKSHEKKKQKKKFLIEMFSIRNQSQTHDLINEMLNVGRTVTNHNHIQYHLHLLHSG